MWVGWYNPEDIGWITQRWNTYASWRNADRARRGAWGRPAGLRDQEARTARASVADWVLAHLEQAERARTQRERGAA